MITLLAFAQTLAVSNVSVLTMQDGATYARNQTVVIDRGVITAVGPAAAATLPPNARVIDGTGMVVMPGLADMHVHLEAAPETWIGEFLKHGVTTVLNLRGGPQHLDMRARIRRDEVRAPTVYTSGPYANRPGIETVEDAIREARAQTAAGYDMIKIHGPLGNLAYHALVDSARIPVVGHAPRNLPFDTLLASGQRMVAHAEELIYTTFTALDSTALGDVPARMAAARVWLIPTLSTFHGIAEQWGRRAAADSALALPDASFFNEALRQYWTTGNPYTGRAADGAAWAFRAYQFQRPLVRALHQAGVRLMAGTDTPVPVMIPGASVHLELRELENAGLSRYDAIAAATRNAGDFIAELVDPNAKFGRIAPGYRADILLVSGDPLADLNALKKPRIVILRGTVVE